MARSPPSCMSSYLSLICCTCLWGFACIPWGIATAGGSDPSSAFREVTSGCVVVGIEHEARDTYSSRGGRTGCDDIYVYAFSRVSEQSTVYASVYDRKRRGPSRCEEEETRAPASFAIGEGAPCWEPAEGLELSDISPPYECANSECVRLFDPALEHDERAQFGEQTLTAGLYLLVISAALACPLGLWSMGSCLMPGSNRAPMRVPGPPPRPAFAAAADSASSTQRDVAMARIVAMMARDRERQKMDRERARVLATRAAGIGSNRRRRQW